MASFQGAAAYRQAAAEGATQIGLLIIAYDALAREFSRAGQAAHDADIAARCKHSNLALTLIGHLESWTSYLDDANLAGSLKQFYGVLRGRTLQIQANGGRGEFEDLAKVVTDTRAVWQQKEHQLASGLPMKKIESGGTGLAHGSEMAKSSFRCAV